MTENNNKTKLNQSWWGIQQDFIGNYVESIATNEPENDKYISNLFVSIAENMKGTKEEPVFDREDILGYMEDALDRTFGEENEYD